MKPARKDRAKATSTVAPNREAATPLYHQVYLVLLEKIQRGEMGEGTRMPTETELCGMFNVSRITVRRALAELENDKLITRIQGTGAFVNQAVPTPPLPQSMDDFFQSADSLRAISNAKLIRFAHIAPPPIVKAAMKLTSDQKVLLSIRVRSYKGTPFLYLTIFTPESLGGKFTKKDLEKESLFWLLRDRVDFYSVEQSISATLADTESAELLNVAIGSALLQITWVIRDEKENVVEYVICAARPDMYRIRNFLNLKP